MMALRVKTSIVVTEMPIRKNERLDEQYGELVIAFDTDQGRLTSMGVVKNSNDQPVEIHITPPQGKLTEEE